MVETSNYLEHHGVLGQKWGVRRYQKADGSYTAAGKKHRNDVSSMSDDDLMKANKRAALENTYKKNNPSEGDSLWKAGESAQQTINSAKRAAEAVDKATKKTVYKGKDVSKMSDQELQKVVNRMNLENQYKRLNTVEVGNRSVERVREILEVTGAVVGIASGVAITASHLKGLRR